MENLHREEKPVTEKVSLNPFLEFIRKITESVLPYLLVFASSLFFPIDIDLGWHLKYGEFFFKHGHILMENTFTQLMPGFHWINTSWGIDLITYSIFSRFGFMGLMIAGAITVTLTFYFISKVANLNFWEKSVIFPVILYLEYPLNLGSFKGQQVSILLTMLMLYLLEKYYAKNYKRLFLLVPLFLIWANIHAQFILGLGIFLLWIFSRSFSEAFLQENSKITKTKALLLLTLIILIMGSTLFNPWGLGIYQESLKQVGNPKMQALVEFKPMPFFSLMWLNHIFIGILLYKSVILLKSKKYQEKLQYLVPASLLYLESFFVRRYAWSLYYLTIPLLQPIAKAISPSNLKHQFIYGVTILTTALFISLLVVNPAKQFSNLGWDKYCNPYRFCSPKAADFIINNNLDSKKVFTLYDWGGWLTWNYPTIKPTIDGRMLLWEDQRGYSGYNEYYSIRSNTIDIDQTDYDVAMVSGIPPIFRRLLQLEQEHKWRLVYQDPYTFVFVRINQKQ